MSHIHTSACWVGETYQPCGEHHPHNYNCGGGTLGPGCPQYVRRHLDDLSDYIRTVEETTSSIKLEVQRLRDGIKSHWAPVVEVVINGRMYIVLQSQPLSYERIAMEAGTSAHRTPTVTVSHPEIRASGLLPGKTIWPLNRMVFNVAVTGSA